MKKGGTAGREPFRPLLLQVVGALGREGFFVVSDHIS